MTSWRGGVENYCDMVPGGLAVMDARAEEGTAGKIVAGALKRHQGNSISLGFGYGTLATELGCCGWCSLLYLMYHTVYFVSFTTTKST